MIREMKIDTNRSGSQDSNSEYLSPPLWTIFSAPCGLLNMKQLENPVTLQEHLRPYRLSLAQMSLHALSPVSRYGGKGNADVFNQIKSNTRKS